MTDRERDPADSGDWPLGKLIRQAMQGRSVNAIATLSLTLGPDYKFSRNTLQHYLDGRRTDGQGGLVVTADTVRRIAAVLDVDPREALRAAGLHAEAERQPPRGKPDAPLDSAKELAEKVVLLDLDDRMAVQRIIDSLAGKTMVTRPEESLRQGHVEIVSVPGGETWSGVRASAGASSEQPAEEAHG